MKYVRLLAIFCLCCGSLQSTLLAQKSSLSFAVDTHDLLSAEDGRYRLFQATREGRIQVSAGVSSLTLSDLTVNRTQGDMSSLFSFQIEDAASSKTIYSILLYATGESCPLAVVKQQSILIPIATDLKEGLLVTTSALSSKAGAVPRLSERSDVCLAPTSAFSLDLAAPTDAFQIKLSTLTEGHIANEYNIFVPTSE